MTVRPARVGLIGCGNVSQHYVAGCASLAAVELVACTDADPARAAALAATAGLRALPLDDLLADPSIDVVVNLTPPVRHTDVSLAAIEAGKHVYSEKPLATTLADAKAMVEAADARGVRLGCAPDTFLGGGLQTARDVLDAGSIGEPLGANAAVLHLGPERWHPDPEIFFARGGGPLLDVGPYYVAALVNLLGPVAAVEAFGTGHGARARHRDRTPGGHPLRGRGAHLRRRQPAVRVGRRRLVPRLVRRRREHLAAPRGARDRGLARDGRPEHVRGRGHAPPHGRRCLGGRPAACRAAGRAGASASPT